MELKVAREHGIMVVALAAPVTLVGAESRAFCDQLTASPLTGRDDIVMDLDNARYIDSAVIGALLRLQNLVLRDGGRLRVTGIQPPVRIMVELMKLRHLFEIVEDLPQAQAQAPLCGA